MTRTPHRLPREGGYALVSLVWLLGVLAVAVAAMSLFSTNTLSVVASSSDRLALDALLRAGVESAVVDILQTKRTDPVRGNDEWRLRSGVVKAAWRSDNARVDVNFAPPDMILALVRRFVEDGGDAEVYARAILDRRPKNGAPALAEPSANVQRPVGGDPDPQSAQGNPQTAQGLVQQRGPGSAAPMAFRHIAELATAGLPPALARRIAAVATVYNGTPKINPRLASRATLELLPDMSEARLRTLLRLREEDSADPNAWVREAGESMALFDLNSGPATRISLRATLAGGFHAGAEVVIVVFPDDKEPYRVLAWDSVSGGGDAASLDGGVE